MDRRAFTGGPAPRSKQPGAVFVELRFPNLYDVFTTLTQRQKEWSCFGQYTCTRRRLTAHSEGRNAVELRRADTPISRGNCGTDRRRFARSKTAARGAAGRLWCLVAVTTE